MGGGYNLAEAIPIGVTRHCAIGAENELSRGALHDPFDLILVLQICDAVVEVNAVLFQEGVDLSTGTVA